MQAPLWLTDRDIALGGFSLENKLLRYAHEPDIEQEIRSLSNPVVVVDALDEAEVRISAQSWREFKESLIKFAKLGVRFVICGRDLATFDVLSAFEEEDLPHIAYELKPFNDAQRIKMVDTLYCRAGGEHVTSSAYLAARDSMLDKLVFEVAGSDDENFAGYAPVLKAVATQLAAEKNLSSKVSSTKFSGIQSVIKSIAGIVEEIMVREQGKLYGSLGEGFAHYENLFSPAEQVEVLLEKVGLLPERPITSVSEKDHDEYKKKRMKQVEDHPFLDAYSATRWSNKVFEGYCLARYATEIPARIEFMLAASKNPFFAVFWSQVEGASIDGYGVAALHSSLLSFASSVDIAGEASQHARGKIQARQGHFSYQGELVFVREDEDYEALLEEVKINGTEEAFFTYRGPLQNMEIDVPEGYVVLDSEERAPFLGPGMVVNAAVVEIASREVKLPASRNRDLFFAIANEYICPLPRISPDGRQLSDQIKLMPRLNGVDSVSKTDLYPYPWPQCFGSYYFELSAEEREAADSSVYKFFRLIEGLRILSTKYGPGGMQVAGFAAKSGLSRGRPETREIIELLQDSGLLKLEGEMIHFVENPQLPLFATPLTRPKNSAPPIESLDADQQMAWARFIAKFGIVTAKAFSK